MVSIDLYLEGSYLVAHAFDVVEAHAARLPEGLLLPEVHRLRAVRPQRRLDCADALRRVDWLR